MGAWGHQTFENDDALDWVGELEEVEDVSILSEAFAMIPDDTEEYVEETESTAALAAAEVVAALRGKPAAALPEEVVRWVGDRRRVKSGLVDEARRAVKRVLANSELRELWEDEPNHFESWKSSVEDLLKRLS
jgi:hypothetical protein